LLEGDPVARRRFLREAKGAAALDHPFIAHIHEIGEWQGRSFFAMEYLEGKLLSERLGEGPLSVEEALQFAVEIAEALHAAHSRGLIHRDLKPSNIMLMREGHAKVMDFGLVKHVAVRKESGDLKESITGLTETGVRLGTVPYMSPEQLNNKELDTRSDIFSFGVLLYEMVAGSNPFRRSDSYRTIGAILHDSPPSLSQVEGATSQVLSHVLSKMLAKKPVERYQDVLEVRNDLLALLNRVRVGNESTAGFRFAPKATKTLLNRGLLLLTALAVMISIWAFWDGADTEAPILRFEIPTENGERLAHFYRQGLAVSPDGSSIVFVSGKVGNPYIFPSRTQLFVRNLSEWRSREIHGTENGFQPFFSPDGSWLAFTQYSEATNSYFLKKVRLDGGDPETLCECVALWGAAWSPEGFIILGSRAGGLRRLSESGGEPEPLTTLDQESGEVSHRLPHLLPDGKGLLYTVPLESDTLGKEARIHALSLEDGRVLELVNGWDGRFVPTGHLVFGQEANLMAVPFDPLSFEIGSPEALVLEGVTHSLYTANPDLRTGAVQLSFSQSGLLAYAAGGVFPEIRNSIVWVDRDGREEILEIEPRNYLTLRLSPNSDRILLSTIYPPHDVWLYDLNRKTMRRQTFKGSGRYGIWGPGTDHLTYSSALEGLRALMVKAVDSGPVEPEVLQPGEVHFIRPGRWTADGGLLTYVVGTGKGQFNLGVLSANGERQLLLDSQFSEQYPEISPDGKWLVYASDESGRLEVYVRPFPGPGKAVQISKDGGFSPAWSPQGDEIFFRWRKEFFAARFEVSGETFTAFEPVKLFEGDYGSIIAVRSYDVANDGRFVMIKRPDQADLEIAVDQFFPPQVKIVSNWFEELRQKLPSD
jgi:serine/threonine-protein kinase